MSVVDEYWEGVVDRLHAEVSVLNRLIDHPGEKGRENEQVLQRVLERLLPRCYGLGTGLLIDAKGGYSSQMDIVIYDQQYHPTLLGQTTPLLHPHETVYAGIEVKTTLRSGDIDDIRKVCKSVRRLHLEPEAIAVTGTDGGDFSVDQQLIEHPLVVAVAYDADMTPETIERRFEAGGWDEQPDLLLVLNQGIVAGRLLGAPDYGPREFAVRLLLVQRRDDAGNRILGQCVTPPPGHSGSTVSYLGRSYPVVTLKGIKVAAEPARALLYFLTRLTAALAEHQISQRPLLLRYLERIEGMGQVVFVKSVPRPMPGASPRSPTPPTPDVEQSSG